MIFDLRLEEAERVSNHLSSQNLKFHHENNPCAARRET